MGKDVQLLKVDSATPNPGRAKSLDVIFIHGLGGDHVGTWKPPSGDTWPQRVANAHPDVQVWALSYPAKIGELLSIGDLDQPGTRGLAVLATERMVNRKIGEKRPCILVCHSLGGLLAKRILLDAWSADQRDARRFRHEGVKAVMFCGTPHRGSAIANVLKGMEWVKNIAPGLVMTYLGWDYSRYAGWFARRIGQTSDLIKELEHNNVDLQHLNEDFGRYYQQRAGGDFMVTVYAETKGMKLKGIPTAVVVPAESADPNLRTGAGPRLQVIAVPDRDHSELVKPASDSEWVIEGLGDLVERVRENVGGRKTQAVTSPPFVLSDMRPPKHVESGDAPAMQAIEASSPTRGDPPVAVDMGEMGRQVFISYAANDTDWTAERVAEFAERLDALQVSVHLDVRHQRSVGGKLALTEWWDWMEKSMASATHVICLCSNRYAEVWERKQSVSGGCGVAFESIRIMDYLYDEKQDSKRRVLTVVREPGHRGMIPDALRIPCPQYTFGNSEDELLLWSHLLGRPPVESGSAPQTTPDASSSADRLPASEAEKQSARKSKKQDSDLLDRTWRKSLEQCSAKVRVEVFKEMQDAFSGQEFAPDSLEQAFDDAFERNGPTTLRAHFKHALRHTHENARLRSLSVEEGDQRNRLYLMLLIRSVALSCQSILRGAVDGNLSVPDAEHRFAIAVASHVIYGHGVQLTIEPGGVRPDNLIDTAAFKDEHAYPPRQAPAISLFESEVRTWLGRALAQKNTSQTDADLKAALDLHESKAFSRPILLDSGELLTDQAVRSLVKEFGMGIVDIAADGVPANIPEGLWLDLCGQLDQQISGWTRHAASKSAPPVLQLTQGSTAQPQSAPPHQTFFTPVGQSNVTTGSQSPIQTQLPAAAQPDAAHDALALAVFSFERTLNDHADLKNDLRELHALVLRRDASSSALSLLPRLLRPLRETAQASPGAADAWERLRNAAHVHWPQSRDFF